MELSKRGLLAGGGAFVAWGLLPIYWHALNAVEPLSLVAHRIVWSFVFLLLLQGFRKGLPAFWRSSLSVSSVAIVVLSAAILMGNWLLYVIAIQTGNVLEASLGYFITPLVNVFLGAALFRERLRLTQVIPICLAAAGVLVAATAFGRVPYFALGLAGSISLYAVAKKFTSLSSVDTSTLEMFSVLVPAVLYLLLGGSEAAPAFFDRPVQTQLLLLATGIITAVPLLWFSCAARLLPMYALGLLQYVSPTLQFSVAVFVFGETFDPRRAVAFGIIWLSIALFVAEGRVRKIQIARRLKRSSPCCAVVAQEGV